MCLGDSLKVTLPASDHIHAVTWDMQGPYGSSALYVYGVCNGGGKSLRNVKYINLP